MSGEEGAGPAAKLMILLVGVGEGELSETSPAQNRGAQYCSISSLRRLGQKDQFKISFDEFESNHLEQYDTPIRKKTSN